MEQDIVQSEEAFIRVKTIYRAWSENADWFGTSQETRHGYSRFTPSLRSGRASIWIEKKYTTECLAVQERHRRQLYGVVNLAVEYTWDPCYPSL